MRRISLMAFGLVSLAGLGFAQINGKVWTGTPNPNDASDPANRSSLLPNATFTTAAINYNSNVLGYTVSQFLNNPVFSNQNNSFNGNGTADNIELELTGSVFLNSGNNSFVVAHDDGLTLNITGIGLVVNQPGPTSPTNTPFNVNNPGAAGLFSFLLDYSECCGAPAELIWQINGSTVGSVPEPSSVALLSTVVGGIALLVRRRKTNNPPIAS